MPALPSVPNVIRVDLFSQVSEDVHALDRFFLSYTSGPSTPTGMTAFAASVVTAWGTHLAPLACSTTVQLLEVIATDLSSPSGAVGIDTSTVVGTRSGTPLEATTCAVVKFDVARRYRGGHPRNYQPFGVEADLAGQQNWASAFISSVETGWTAFATEVIGAGASPATLVNQVNVSYYEGFTVITNPITHRARNVPTVRATPVVDNVTGISMNPRPGTQRRRALQST